MLPDTPPPMNFDISYQFALNLADICLDNSPKISCKSLLSFAKSGRFTTQKSPHFGLRNFERLTSKYYILLSFQRFLQPWS